MEFITNGEAVAQFEKEDINKYLNKHLNNTDEYEIEVTKPFNSNLDYVEVLFKNNEHYNNINDGLFYNILCDCLAYTDRGWTNEAIIVYIMNVNDGSFIAISITGDL